MTREETFKMLSEYVDFLLEKSDAEHPYWNIENVLSGSRILIVLHMDGEI